MHSSPSLIVLVRTKRLKVCQFYAKWYRSHSPKMIASNYANFVSGLGNTEAKEKLTNNGKATILVLR